MHLFMDVQGCPFKENIIYQDNESAMRLESNGRKSCGKRARHMETRCFCIEDFTGKGLAQVKHCPTEKNLADFLRSLCKEIYLVILDVSS